jgi:hypothetical protein
LVDGFKPTANGRGLVNETIRENGNGVQHDDRQDQSVVEKNTLEHTQR